MLHKILGAFFGSNIENRATEKVVGTVANSFLSSGKTDTFDPIDYTTGDEHTYSKSVEGLAKKHQTEVKAPASSPAKYQSQSNAFPEGYNNKLSYALSDPKLLRFFKNIKNYEIKDNRTIYLGNTKYITKEDEIRMNNKAGVDI